MRGIFRIYPRFFSETSTNSVRRLTLYGRCYNKSPTLTSAVVGCVLFALGDITRQQIVEKKGRNHELRETLRMGTLGLIWVGPVINTWYMILEKIVRMPGTRGVLIKIACDQLLFAPVLILTIVSFLKKPVDKEEFKQVVSTEYLTVLKTNYFFWPLVQFITFRFVPLSLRVVWVNAVSVVWNTFISWVMYGNKKSQDV